jgi:hypothetical protein
MSDLDREIDKILNSKINERVKAKLYAEILRRFLIYKDDEQTEIQPVCTPRINYENINLLKRQLSPNITDETINRKRLKSKSNIKIRKSKRLTIKTKIPKQSPKEDIVVSTLKKQTRNLLKKLKPNVNRQIDWEQYL